MTTVQAGLGMTHCDCAATLIVKNGLLLCVYFRPFKQILQISQQISSIWNWDSNPRPSEHESPLTTTRPGLLP